MSVPTPTQTEQYDPITLWALDFDPELKCESNRPCSNSADHEAKCRKCPAGILMCTECVALLTAITGGIWRCDDCGLTGGCYLDIRSVSPIGATR